MTEEQIITIQEPFLEVDELPEELKMMGIGDMPYKSILCFELLIKKMEYLKEEGSSGEQYMAEKILERISENPELRGPIESCKIGSEFKEVVEFLIMALVPPSQQANQLKVISIPLSLDKIYQSPAFVKLINENEGKYEIKSSPDEVRKMMILNACCFILNKFYGQQFQLDYPLILKAKDLETGALRYFKPEMDMEFVDIKLLKPLNPLTQEQINELLSNIYDINLWLKYLPPNHFEFQGFVIGNMTDITNEESLSRLRFRLLEKSAVTESDNIAELESLVKTYLGLPNIRLGLTAIDYPIENSVSHKYKIRYDFLAGKHDCLLHPENKNSIYEKACKYKEVILVENLEQVKHKTQLERDLLEAGIRSILIAPLVSKDKNVVGLLEIASPTAYELNSFVELRFKEIIGLFGMAVERSREEIDNRIEAIILEKYTAIHPSVEWKFTQASFNILDKQGFNDVGVEAEQIVFKDVYPLYGQADIVSSSKKRNKAIQADLIENLRMAAEILSKCIEAIYFPILNQYYYKVTNEIEHLENDFNSTDETRIVEILHDDIHPLFRQIETRFESLSGLIQSYFLKIDQDLGVLYSQRKDYEDSVTMLNNAIANYLDKEEVATQEILPHYFEKYKTDGVEYDMYVGQSLLNRGQFHTVHLKNMRLWQLISMCEVTRLVDRMQSKLIVPLTTAQLIFVYSNPLSIRFRMDEKQFDVDGAYNVRYEILKKRIDKAVIEDTGERLTVKGKVAIVYLQEKDKNEYLDYFDYLINNDYIAGEIEDVKLGRLQGVQGLRALRFEVKL